MNSLPIRLFRIIVYSNIFVALAAACATLSGSMLLGIGIHKSYLPSSIVGISTFIVYNFQRLWRIQTEFENDRKRELNDRVKWMYEHRSTLIVSVVFFTILLSIQLLKLNQEALIFLAISGVLSLLYVMPVVPFKGKRKMLREIPFLKIYLVGIAWVLATVYFPAINANGLECLKEINTHLIAVERFIFIFAITLPFDVRDMHFDRDNGLQTFVIKYGVKRVVKSSIFMLSVLAFLNIIASIAMDDLLVMQLSNALNYIITAIIVFNCTADKGELFYSGLIESTLIVQFILIFVAKWML